MSVELPKLYSRAVYGSRIPSPNGIVIDGEKLQFFKELEKRVGGDFPYDIIPVFYSKKGVFDDEMFATFGESAKLALKIFDDKALTFLTRRCIKKDGSINLRRLKREINR